jgi:hypothetical protein
MLKYTILLYYHIYSTDNTQTKEKRRGKWLFTVNQHLEPCHFRPGSISFDVSFELAIHKWSTHVFGMRSKPSDSLNSIILAIAVTRGCSALPCLVLKWLPWELTSLTSLLLHCLTATSFHSAAGRYKGSQPIRCEREEANKRMELAAGHGVLQRTGGTNHRRCE